MTQEKKGAKVGICSLVKRFGPVLAVDHVSLEIERGEFITLLGPSGSGKTTTLMIIAGFEIPESGEVLIDDDSILSRPAYKRGIGMVFQNYSLFPHMTVEQNIGFPLRMRKVGKGESSSRTKQALKLVRLSGYEKRFPRQLSGGQQQRIALARALVFNPYVLLMDEPLGALDKKLREHMQLEIKQITQSLNITAIYVTHDQGEAMTMSDRIAVMNEGRIEQIGSPREIYDSPRNYFVADFIGESNFIEGKIKGYAGQTCHFTSHQGMNFTALSSQDKPVGKEACLVIRPEKIAFVKESQSFSNQLEALIDEAIYLGDVTFFRAKSVHHETVLTIKQQNKFINRFVKKGDRVTIGWNEKDNWVV